MSVNCLAWTADRLISGSNDNTIRTWDTSTWLPIAVLTGHTGHVSDMALSPNGRLLASISWSYWDRSARLWNLDDGRPIGYPLQHRSDAGRVSFSADGTLLATASDDKNAYTWDVAAILEEAGLEELLQLVSCSFESLFNQLNSSSRMLKNHFSTYATSL